MEEAQLAFEYLNDIEKKMNSANHQLTKRTDYESQEYLDIITEFNNLEERFRMGIFMILQLKSVELLLA